MLNSSDLFGTPYRLLIDSGTGEEILVHPPTLRYFEALVTTYNISLNEAISPSSEIKDEVAYIRMVSRTMQMLHMAAYMIDESITYEQVELWSRNDPEVLTRYIKSIAEHLPSNDKKPKSVIKPKKPLTPKMWIPR